MILLLPLNTLNLQAPFSPSETEEFVCAWLARSWIRGRDRLSFTTAVSPFRRLSKVATWTAQEEKKEDQRWFNSPDIGEDL